MTVDNKSAVKPKLGKVLAVNADPEITRILGVNLIHASLEFVTARNGQEAVARALSERPDVIVLAPPLPDITFNEVCQRLQDSPRTSEIPIILIGDGQPRNGGHLPDNENIHYITKPFDPAAVVALVRRYLNRRQRAAHPHPLTGLPDRAQVELELTSLIEDNQDFAVVGFAIENPKPFNQRYGYARGDRVIRLLADILADKTARFGHRDDLAGHIGGNKFVIITTPENARPLLQRIVPVFNRRVRQLYHHADPDDTGNTPPMLRLHTAILTSREYGFRHHREVSEAIITALKPPTHSSVNLRASDTPPENAAARGCVTGTQREELRALQGVLDWLDFTIRELDTPLTTIRNKIESLTGDNLNTGQKNSLKIINTKLAQLNQTLEGLNTLARNRRRTARAIFEEVDIPATLEWVARQVRETTNRKNINVDISVADKLGPISLNRRALTECLLHVVRGEVRSLPAGGRLEIRAAAMNEEFLTILIIAPGKNAPLSTDLEKLKRRIYPARLLLQGLGGKLNVAARETGERVYTFVVPRRWHGWLQEVNSLQLATETSRKEAQTELVNLRQQLAALPEPIAPVLKDGLEKLKGKIQELGVLGNRTLFLTEDLNSRLEVQQDALLQQETEQLASLEAMLAMAREIATSLNLADLFNLESAERISGYAFSIARELRLPESERRSLRYAALLYDLALVISPQELLRQGLTPSKVVANNVRERFRPVWQALNGIPFLQNALGYVRYIYNMYAGNGRDYPAAGGEIPLAARILAVAGRFELLTSGRISGRVLSTPQALQRLAAASGGSLDPDVVSVFLQLQNR